MIELAEDHELPPGTWYLWRTGKLRILIACPLCSHVTVADFDEGAEVTVDGVLTPMFQCPNEDCKVWDYVRLAGWDPAAV